MGAALAQSVPNGGALSCCREHRGGGGSGRGNLKGFFFGFIKQRKHFYTIFFYRACPFFFAREIYIFKTLENRYIKNIGKSLHNTIIRNIGKSLYS
jgi:hypothetical protein